MHPLHRWTRLWGTSYVTFLLIMLSPVCAWSTPASWQCLCYQERYQGTVVDATACRSTAKACARLQARVKTGSKAIVKGSLRVPCTSVSGTHPADYLGGKEQWIPSKKPGATWTPGGCFLKTAPSPQPRHRIELKRGQPELHLESGWVVKPVTDAVNGHFEFQATSPGKAGKTFEHVSPFGEDSMKPRCAFLMVELGEVRMDTKDPLIFLQANCEAEGEDIRSAEDYFALLSIDNTALKTTRLWSGKGDSFMDHSTGVEEWSLFHVKANGPQVQVFQKSETCSEDPKIHMREDLEPDSERGARCTKKERRVHSLKYP